MQILAEPLATCQIHVESRQDGIRLPNWALTLYLLRESPAIQRLQISTTTQDLRTL